VIASSAPELGGRSLQKRPRAIRDRAINPAIPDVQGVNSFELYAPARRGIKTRCSMIFRMASRSPACGAVN
jgi:hypothetical protein